EPRHLRFEVLQVLALRREAGASRLREPDIAVGPHNVERVMADDRDRLIRVEAFEAELRYTHPQTLAVVGIFLVMADVDQRQIEQWGLAGQIPRLAAVDHRERNFGERGFAGGFDNIISSRFGLYLAVQLPITGPENSIPLDLFLAIFAIGFVTAFLESDLIE